MTTPNAQRRRNHNLFLINKLLSHRDSSSPFTFILDTLEQSGQPLLTEIVQNAQASNVEVIFVSFETIERPPQVTFIATWNDPKGWLKRVKAEFAKDVSKRRLVVFDSVNSLAAEGSLELWNVLSSFVSPLASVVGVFHKDVPLTSTQFSENPYAPRVWTLLNQLATTIFTVHSLHHDLAREAARNRSQAEPLFGLDEGIDGVIIGRHANGLSGMVLEMEHRRHSGRAVKDWFFFPIKKTGSRKPTGERDEAIILLEDHPSYKKPVDSEPADNSAHRGGGAETTFDLGLTDRQRQDREGVVLPYFEAQQGGGDAGRILYDMGAEDDFDDEEDEV